MFDELRLLQRRAIFVSQSSLKLLALKLHLYIMCWHNFIFSWAVMLQAEEGA